MPELLAVLIASGELGQWAKDVDCNHMHWVSRLHSVHTGFPGPLVILIELSQEPAQHNQLVLEPLNLLAISHFGSSITWLVFFLTDTENRAKIALFPVVLCAVHPW